MQLIEVTTPTHIKQFLNMVNAIYTHYPLWIRPLDTDIEATFDRKKNKLFRHGNAIRWILLNDRKEVIGRVAAFFNTKNAKKGNDQPTGGMGFFECINNQEAANMLFDACKNWLMAQGMEAMDGIINFGDRDRFWGLHIEGDFAPNYGMFYHPPYYKTLIEKYGFQIYFKQYTYWRKIERVLDQKVFDKAERVTNNPKYRFEHLQIKKIEKYAHDFMVIYNKAWSKHLGTGDISHEQAIRLMNTMKPILDPEIVWFGYYEDEPVAFYIMIPDLNEIAKFLNGRFDWWGKAQFFWHFKIRKMCKKVVGLIFGVVPEHQGKGVEAAIVVAYSKVCFRDNYPYNEIEFNWIGDFNPAMMRVCENVGGKVRKTHATYRKLFDESKEFKRMPIIGEKTTKTSQE